LGIKQAGDAVVNNQIKDETVIGGAAEVAYPIGLTDRVQARPFGEMRTGLEDVARIGVGALDSTPAMSRDPVAGHRYPVNGIAECCFHLAMITRRWKNRAFFHQIQTPITNPHALGHAWA